MRTRVRLTSAAVAAMMTLAQNAEAQVNFYTQGYFTTTPSVATCNATAPMLGAPQNASCSGGGFMLNYTAVPQNPGLIASGSVVSLGQFSLTGTGNVAVPANTVQFTLLLRQTAPSAGTGTFLGYITGTVATDGPNGDLSTLVWRPNQFVNVGLANYQMIFDNFGPGAGTGLAIPINQTRGITALVTTVPEPSTYVLMASGLATLGLMYRRRRA